MCHYTCWNAFQARSEYEAPKRGLGEIDRLHPTATVSLRVEVLRQIRDVTLCSLVISCAGNVCEQFICVAQGDQIGFNNFCSIIEEARFLDSIAAQGTC